MRKNWNLFTIGEVAQAVGVTRRILLHYEECGLVQPDVKDGPTGNRYYSIDTFVKIRTIRIFQNLGLSLNEIRGYFDDSVDLPQLIGRLETLRDEAAFCAAVPPGSTGEYVETLPAVPALSLYHHGVYEDLPAAEKKLRAYARQHGFTPKGTLRRIYLEGPPQHKDPAKFITQVALPIEEEE